jgi:hypothetical protein
MSLVNFTGSSAFGCHEALGRRDGRSATVLLLLMVPLDRVLSASLPLHTSFFHVGTDREARPSSENRSFRVSLRALNSEAPGMESHSGCLTSPPLGLDEVRVGWGHSPATVLALLTEVLAAPFQSVSACRTPCLGIGTDEKAPRISSGVMPMPREACRALNSVRVRETCHSGRIMASTRRFDGREGASDPANRFAPIARSLSMGRWRRGMVSRAYRLHGTGRADERAIEVLDTNGMDVDRRQ